MATNNNSTPGPGRPPGTSTDLRPYKVLVERAGKDKTYREVWEGPARNAEHAARQAMKESRGLRAEYLITVPLKMWTEVSVRRNVRETISIG